MKRRREIRKEMTNSHIRPSVMLKKRTRKETNDFGKGKTLT